jgi:hypothetical protein
LCHEVNIELEVQFPQEGFVWAVKGQKNTIFSAVETDLSRPGMIIYQGPFQKMTAVAKVEPIIGKIPNGDCLEFLGVVQDAFEQGLETHKLVDGDTHIQYSIQITLKTGTDGLKVGPNDLVVTFMEGSDIHIQVNTLGEDGQSQHNDKNPSLETKHPHEGFL